MEKNKQLYLKLYRQRREQQKIDEINKQKEKIRQRELKEKEIKEREIKEKEEREKNKYKIKEKDEEKSMISKSIHLPPVKARKSSMTSEIDELINKSKIRIASSHINYAESAKISNIQKIDEKKEKDEKSSDEEDIYGSGDFVDLSNEDKKTKSKIDTSKKVKEINMDDDLSGKIDMILNESHTDQISVTNNNNNNNNKDNSESYNDFENSDALDKKGILTEKTEQDKSKSNINAQSNYSSEEYKF